MSEMIFDGDTAIRIKRHYQEEYNKTLNKLMDLKSVLDEMSHIEIGESGVESFNFLATASTDKVQNADSSSQSKKKSASAEKPKAKRSYTKKRGRKPIWGKFIKSRLRATQTPLSYDDMAYHAIAIKNLEPGEFAKVRQKIVAAAFTLRNKQQAIDTYAIKGSRTKYMGFTDWFEREGLLKQEYRDKIKA